MDLDSFLEKDIIAYLENAINFDTADKQKLDSEIQVLLSEKELQENVMPTPIPTLDAPGAPSSLGTETSAVPESTTSKSTIPEPAHASEEDSFTEDIPDEHPPIAIQAKNVVVQEEKPESQTTPTSLLPDIDKRREELETIIRLEDTLNDLHHAIMQHDRDKAHALLSYLEQETQKIKYHLSEKKFLEQELSQFKKELEQDTSSATAPDETVIDNSFDESTNPLTQEEQENNQEQEAVQDQDQESSTLSEEDYFEGFDTSASKKTSLTTDIDEPSNTAIDDESETSLVEPTTSSPEERLPSFVIDPLELPPSFLQEETKAMYSYAQGVQAIRYGQKTKALEIFLRLAKQRPKNLAIKIRLAEAIDLP